MNIYNEQNNKENNKEKLINCIKLKYNSNDVEIVSEFCKYILILRYKHFSLKHDINLLIELSIISNNIVKFMNDDNSNSNVTNTNTKNIINKNYLGENNKNFIKKYVEIVQNIHSNEIICDLYDFENINENMSENIIEKPIDF